MINYSVLILTWQSIVVEKKTKNPIKIAVNSLVNMELYSSSSKVNLPPMALVQKYKVIKIWLCNVVWYTCENSQNKMSNILQRTDKLGRKYFTTMRQASDFLQMFDIQNNEYKPSEKI